MSSPTTPAWVVPRGVPVIPRPDGRFQVGSAARSAVVTTTRPSTAATSASEEAEAWAVYDPTGPEDRMVHRADATVAVVGSPRTGDVVLGLLAEAGVGALLCDRPEAVPAAVRTGRHLGDSGPADLVVLIDEHAARPVRADGVLADGVDHLSVVLRDTDALVGPMVLPGRSACLRCVDRWRGDADPWWPVTRDALNGGPPRPVDVATAHAVAGLVVLQVLSHLDGTGPDCVGSTLELLLPEGSVRRRGWAPHPDCGCVQLPLHPTTSQGTPARS